MNEVVDRLMDAIERYWNLAYAEGKEGRTQDTPNGDAQRTLHEISLLIHALQSPQPERAMPRPRPESQSVVSVDVEALREVLQALLGPDHQIRELQHTRGLAAITGQENPIDILVREYKSGLKL